MAQGPWAVFTRRMIIAAPVLYLTEICSHSIAVKNIWEEEILTAGIF